MYKIGEKNFELEEFVDVGRVITSESGSNCFYLPPIKISPVKIGDFTGSIAEGGSCNVDILCLTPHNVTHIETSAHILRSGGVPVSALDTQCLHGLCYLIDLSGSHDSEFIDAGTVIEKLNRLEYPIQLLAIKTPSSLLPSSYDFSGKNFLALSPDLAHLLANYDRNGSSIRTLVLDLPSVDKEDDSALIAHRRFMEIPEGVIEFDDRAGRAVVELAYFGDLQEGYYYCSITPPRIKTNAVPVSVALARLRID